jgi:hypothetical protein
MPGMALEILGAVQQAPQKARQEKDGVGIMAAACQMR